MSHLIHNDVDLNKGATMNMTHTHSANPVSNYPAGMPFHPLQMLAEQLTPQQQLSQIVETTLRFLYQQKMCSRPDFEYLKQGLASIQSIHQETMAEAPKWLPTLHHIRQRFTDIDYIEAQGNYCRLVCNHSPFEEEFRILLKDIELFEEGCSFLRVHKSYMVNPQHVTCAHISGTYTYYLEIHQHAIPIGRAYLAEIRKRYPHWFK